MIATETSTTTTTTTTTTVDTEGIKINPTYLKSPQGILRLIEIVLCIIAFICAAIVPGYGHFGYIQFATICGFLVAMVFFLINLFEPHIPNYRPHGVLVECIITAVFVLLLAIAGILASLYAGYHGIVIAILLFSFLAAAAYAISTVFLFRDWRISGGQLPGSTTESPPPQN